MAVALWAGSSSFSSGDTPWGLYDTDTEFTSSAEKFMNTSRKVPKSHQNVLMFSKGNPKETAKRLGKFKDNFEDYIINTNNKFW